MYHTEPLRFGLKIVQCAHEIHSIEFLSIFFLKLENVSNFIHLSTYFVEFIRKMECKNRDAMAWHSKTEE